MDWITGFLSILAIYLLGNKNRWGWVAQFINQFFWLYIVFHKELWGLLPVIIVITYLSIRNFIIWSKS